MGNLSEHLPFTSEVAGSILSENVLNFTRTQCSTHANRVSQHYRKSSVFSGYSGFLPQGMLTGWVEISP